MASATRMWLRSQSLNSIFKLGGVRRYTQPRAIGGYKGMESDLEYLRKEDQVWLLKLTQECKSISEWLKKNMPPPQPQHPRQTIDSAGYQQYICTHKMEDAQHQRRKCEAAIAYVKEVRLHCEDLMNLPYPEWDPTSFDKSAANAQQGQTDEEYRLTLEMEEVRERAILNSDMQKLEEQVGMLKAKAEDALSEGDETKYAAKAITDDGESPILGGWDELYDQLEEQIERDGSKS